MTQYFDMLKEIGASSRSNAILIPHSPRSFTRLTEQMRSALTDANQTAKASEARPDLPPELRLTFPLNVPGNGS
jgi:hypothetical protein